MLQHLPLDLFYDVLDNLNVEDVARFCCVSKYTKSKIQIQRYDIIIYNLNKIVSRLVEGVLPNTRSTSCTVFVAEGLNQCNNQVMNIAIIWNKGHVQSIMLMHKRRMIIRYHKAPNSKRAIEKEIEIENCKEAIDAIRDIPNIVACKVCVTASTHAITDYQALSSIKLPALMDLTIELGT